MASSVRPKPTDWTIESKKKLKEHKATWRREEPRKRLASLSDRTRLRIFEGRQTRWPHDDELQHRHSGGPSSRWMEIHGADELSHK